MRPDAHKKKASTQYKKKHGIPKEKKSDVKSLSAERRDPSDGKKAIGDGLGTSARPETAEVSPTAGVATSDSFVDCTFKRRTVTSNWSRYEEIGEDEDDNDVHDDLSGQLRGADFRLLLDVATNSLSHFRFADEKDWEADSSDLNSFLSIDCVDLANALQCEPLPARLGLPPSTFSSAQHEQFIAVAECQKQKYVRKAHPMSLCMDEVDDVDLDPGENFSEQEVSDVDSEDNVSLPGSDTSMTVQTQAKDTNEGTLIASESDSLKDIGHLRTINPAIVPTEVPVKPSTVQPEEIQQTCGTEDDLDFLLSLDEPLKEKSGPEEQFEDEVEPSFLVSVPSPNPPTGASNDVPVQSTNLEDWLDDFLDD